MLEQLYGDAEPDDVPKEVLVPNLPEDQDLYEEFLSMVRGSKVRVRVPQRGEKRALLTTVGRNAQEAFTRHKLKRASDHNARAKALTALQEALELPEAPLRIECFDISNLQGTEIVASMTVLEDGIPKRSDYRRFKIRDQEGQDDFAAMEEALTRRFRRYLLERDEGARAGKRFAYPPNLLVIDGGKGQLGVAVRVLEDLGLEDISVVGLAKRFEEVYRPGESDPVRIPRDSQALYLLQQVRDEAHRFAITYHRTLRAKKMTTSVLDDVPGLGPTRRTRLLKEFGSVKRLREQDPETLKALRWLPDAVAVDLYARLHGEPLPSTPHERGAQRERRPSPSSRPASTSPSSPACPAPGAPTSANVLEDLGFFVIDNLPPALIGKVAELARGGSSPQRYGFGVDVRTGSFVEDLDEALAELRALGARTRVLFLEASDDALVRRFDACRRPHPLADAERLLEGIQKERALLEELKGRADVVIDTSMLNVHELRDRLVAIFAADAAATSLQVDIVSFGFKHGLPLDVDLVFDCRFLPNPHWVDELRPLDGRDAPVRDYVMSQDDAKAYLAELQRLFELTLPAYEREGKAYLSIALGCTGGRHRSVAMAEALGGILGDLGYRPHIRHRDVDRE